MTEQIISLIVSLSKVVTAIVTIVGAIKLVIKPLKKQTEMLEEQQRHNKENYLSILRLTIMSEEMPLSERIKAGDKYVELGGNGAVKKKYHELIDLWGKGTEQ